MDLKILANQVKKDEWINLIAPVATDNIRIESEEEIYKFLVDSSGLANNPIKMNIWFIKQEN